MTKNPQRTPSGSPRYLLSQSGGIRGLIVECFATGTRAGAGPKNSRKEPHRPQPGPSARCAVNTTTHTGGVCNSDTHPVQCASRAVGPTSTCVPAASVHRCLVALLDNAIDFSLRRSNSASLRPWRCSLPLVAEASQAHSSGCGPLVLSGTQSPLLFSLIVTVINRSIGAPAGRDNVF